MSILSGTSITILVLGVSGRNLLHLPRVRLMDRLLGYAHFCSLIDSEIDREYNGTLIVSASVNIGSDRARNFPHEADKGGTFDLRRHQWCSHMPEIIGRVLYRHLL